MFKLQYGHWITRNDAGQVFVNGMPIDMTEHGHVPVVIKAGFGPRFIVALSDVAQIEANFKAEGNYIREVYVAEGDHY